MAFVTKPTSETSPKKQRIGVAKGRFVVPDNIDEDNEEIARVFYEDADCEPEEVPDGR
jgi:hypothetical protein